MKTLTSIVAVTALSLGGAGAAIAYTSNSDSPTASTRITPPTPAADPEGDTVVQEPAAQIRTRFRPCKRGTELEGGKCVRHIVRTVVVPAPPAPVVASTPTTRSRSEDQRGSGPRESTEDRDVRAREDQESEGEEHGEDQDQDDSEHSDEQEQGDDD